MTGRSEYLEGMETLPPRLLDALESGNMTAADRAEYRRLIRRLKREVRQARERENLRRPPELMIEPEPPWGVD